MKIKVKNINNVPIPEKLREILRQLNSIPIEASLRMSIQERRKVYEEFVFSHRGQLLSIKLLEDTAVLSPEGHQIPIRIYIPCLRKKLPVLMYIHGGGWEKGSITTHDSICRYLSNIGNCLIVSLEWRLAPEHRFPKGLDDVLVVYDWIIHNIHTYSGDAKKVAVGGDSAGANLAASLTHFLKRHNADIPYFQLLIYPCVNLKMQTPSYKEFATGFLLTSANVKRCIEGYIQNKQDLENPLVNPILESDFSGLPSTCIITAEYDPLRDEGKKYFRHLQKANVPSTYICASQMVHSFLHLTGSVREAKEHVMNIGEIVRKNLHA